MRIGYLIAQFPKPSETFVSREVLTLRRLGLDVQPFAFESPTPNEANDLDRATRSLIADVKYLRPRKAVTGAIQSLPGIVRGWRENSALQQVSTFESNQPLRLLRAVSLARELQSAGIRHLHAHWPYATQVAYLVHKLTGISFSASIHAHEVEHDDGHFPTVFESLSFATFCNRAAMEHLLARLPAPARERSHLIYHGVDLERYPLRLFPREESPLRVISAGRFTRTKGFDRLLRACAKFRSLGGAVELTILGQGNEEKRIKHLSRELGFTKHLHLPGWLPHDQVAERLGEAHLFALMADTNFCDGLPNVVLEAMASARPVVLSPLPAAHEAVSDGVEGFILNSAGDEAGMVQVLQQCATDPSRLPGMGQTARRRIEKVFDAAIHARRLKNLFEQRLRGSEDSSNSGAPMERGLLARELETGKTTAASRSTIE